MISALEIKQKLSLVSMGKLSLNSFEDWFVPRAWNVHKDNSSEAIELVASIHLLFSERDDHILNESKLRDELTSLLSKGVRYVQIEYPSELIGVPQRPNPVWQVRGSSPFEFVSVRA